MPACQSCGGDNPPAAATCQYCDHALVGEKLLEVAWSARTSEGASGEGRAVVMSPLGADPERIRAVCESAFSASVDALGPESSAAQIASDMRERVVKQLPHDHPLNELVVTHFQAFLLVAGEAPVVAPDPGASPAGIARGLLVGCFLFALGGCCLTSGLTGFAVGGGKQRLAKKLLTLQPLSPEEAAQAGGEVCLEGVVASVDSALIVRVAAKAGPPAEIPCIYVSEKITQKKLIPRGKDANGRPRDPREELRTRTEAHAVERFQVGGLVVEPTASTSTVYVALESVAKWEDGDTTHVAEGLRVGTQLTLHGRVQGGVLRPQPGDDLLISGLPTRKQTAEALEAEGAGDQTFGVIASALGALLLVLGLVSFLRRSK